MKKKLIVILTVCCMLFACLGVIGCGETSGTGNGGNATNAQIMAIYNSYLLNAQEQGVSPLSYEDWLATIKGEKGDQGEQGIQGEKGDKGDQGEQGKSAYQTWLENGNTGTQADFLEWLKGQKGDKGDQGEQGIQGNKGDQGVPGVGIVDMYITEDGYLMVKYTNSSVYVNLGKVVPSSHEHTFGDWLIYVDSEINCEEVILYRQCSGCNEIVLKKGTYSDHEFETNYSFDEIAHYLKCKNCEVTKSREEHIFGDSSNCTACGAEPNVLYELTEDGTGYVVCGIEDASVKELLIPSNYKGKPVVEIADFAFCNIDIESGEPLDKYKFTSVTIPKSIKRIGEYAFTYCNLLENLNFEANSQLTTIEYGAFAYCLELKSVKVPDSVTSIGEWAFTMCSSLTSIIFGENSQLTSIGEAAFIGCSSLTSIEIPDSVTSIGEAAFSGCSSLTSIEIPDSVTSIGRSVFSGCSLLTSIEIPDSVTSIGDTAFINCKALETVYYAGTTDEWNNIDKGSDWAYDCEFTIECSDGSIDFIFKPKENITIYTGGTGGTYYAFTNGLQIQLARKTDYNYTVVGDTGGSVANLKAMSMGDCNMAIVQNDTMINAYNGLTNNFKETGAITNFSVIGQVYPEVIQIVTDDPSIKSLADLKGSNKSVSIGDVGSGVEANAVALLQKYGIDIYYDDAAKKYVSSDIKIENLSVAKSADAMKDNKLDVFFFTSGAPATSIWELSISKQIYMIGLDVDIMAEFIADNKIDGQYNVYSVQPITNDQYSFIPADPPVFTIGVRATYIVSNDLSEEVVYNITKVIWESKGSIGHWVESTMNTDYAFVTIGNVPIHPGAERYYREIGLI